MQGYWKTTKQGCLPPDSQVTYLLVGHLREESPRTRWPLSRLSRLALMAWMHDLAEVREPRHPLGLTGRIQWIKKRQKG